MAWGEVFNVAIDAGWLEGVKVGRKADQIEAIVNSATGLYMPAALNFRVAYYAMFLHQLPFIEKIVSSYRLPLGDIMNIFPAGEGVTLGVRTSGATEQEQEQKHQTS